MEGTTLKDSDITFLRTFQFSCGKKRTRYTTNICKKSKIQSRIVGERYTPGFTLIKLLRFIDRLKNYIHTFIENCIINA